MKITREQAKEFLEEIKQEDKVMILCHNDLDGFVSGILVYDYLVKKGVGEIEIASVKLGETDPKKIFQNLDALDKIIFVDVPTDGLNGLLDALEDKEVLMIDHHKQNKPFPDFPLNYNTFEKGYFPASRTVYELIQGRDWMALIGVVGDRGDLYSENKEFIKELLNEYGFKLNDFFEKVINKLNYVLAYFDNGDTKAFFSIQKLKSLEDVDSLEEFYKPIQEELEFFKKDFKENADVFGNVYVYYFEPKYKIKKALVADISRGKEENVFVFLSPSSDEGVISLSGRGGNEKFCALDICKAGIKDCEGDTGGHPRGVGGAIRKQDLEKFKENIKKFVLGNE